MKKPFCLFSLLAILSLACAIQAAAPTQLPDKQPEVATIVAATLQAMITPVPAQPASPSRTAHRNQSARLQWETGDRGNTSFVIPNGLATAASGAQIPAADEQNAAPRDVAPAHLEITLDGYTFLPSASSAKIFIYPALDYATAHQGAAESMKRLQAILANPASATKDNLPAIPFYNAAQMFASQVNIIKFQSGAGVRMVTAYGQAAGQITKDTTFYHFEGLTIDNKYYIIAILPIQTPSENIQFPGHDAPAATLEQYYDSVSAALNSAAPAKFVPNLTALDAFLESMQITP